jgi:hypothetical protein
VIRALTSIAITGTLAEILILGQVVSENYFMLLGTGVITTLCGSVAYLYKQAMEDRAALRRELDECQTDRQKLWEAQAQIWERVARVERKLDPGV